MSKTDRRLKIFADCHVFDGNFQGTTTFLKGIYLEMIKDTAKDFYFAASDLPHLKTIFGEADNIHYLQYCSHNKFYRLLVDIPRLIKKNGIDYAHFQYVAPPVRHCKYITTIHDVLFLDYPQYFPFGYRIKNRLLFSLSAKRSYKVTTVSQYSKDRIEKHFGISDILITPNAVDPIYFASFDKTDVRDKVAKKFGISNYWLYVSRWEPRKNHHRLLKVFAEKGYYKYNWLVFVGGKAIACPEFDTIYASLPKEVKEKVLIINRLKFSDLILLVKGASLSVYPSIAEGFGIPPLEAAAAGVPVVCSNSTAMSDFKFFGSTLFNPLSEEDMCRAIECAASDGDVEAIKQAITQQYDWKISAENLLKAME